MSYKRKLIEVALPLDAINRESAREKSIRHGHPSTLHLWWARRPLAAARAVLWSSLVDDPSAHPDRFPTEEDQDRERERLFRILEELVKWKNSSNSEVLEAAKAEIQASSDGELPKVLDPFCGGGTIPLEAQRLGLPAYGGDLNPVAVLISKAMVEIPPRFAGLPPVNPESQKNADLRTWEGAQGLAEDVRYYGEWMRDRAFEKIGHLYPKVKLPTDQGGGEATVIAWIWARTVESPDPSWTGHVPLVRSWVLRKEKRGNKVVWVEPVVDPESQSITYTIREGGSPPRGTVHRARGECIATGAPIAEGYIKEEAEAGRMKASLIGIVAHADSGRRFLEPVAVNLPDLPDSEIPSIRLSTHPQYMGPPRYGLHDTSDLFTARQLHALTCFSDLLREAREEVQQALIRSGEDRGASPTYAEAIETYLAFVVDKCADYWSSIVTWRAGGGFLGHVFSRQAIPMAWDYAEANPFSESTGNWLGMLDWVVRAIRELPAVGEGWVRQSDAAKCVATAEPSVISTDPPYYDNVPYADISDFFYAWLRRNLNASYPDLLSTVAAPKAEELVADSRRHKGADKARSFFEHGIREVFKESVRRQPPGYPMTFYYAFKQEETDASGTASTGWETFLQGLHDSGISILRTWPIRTELSNRTRAISSGALASSIVIACRPRAVDAGRVSAAEFVAALRGELPGAIRLLQKQSIAPVDMAQSAIGPGMAVFSRYAEVVEADGKPMSVRRALILINEVLQEVLSEEETEFDSDTRWALTWFEQNGLNPGPFGDADTLSKAKNTSVRGVVDSGVAVQREGKVRLRSRDELSADWDPDEDSRLTVWEATQHLIAALGESELDAADLLRRLGDGVGEQARQLSYLLYQVSDRKGWAEEAVAYNGLVQAWPEISRQAARTDTSTQPTLGE